MSAAAAQRRSSGAGEASRSWPRDVVAGLSVALVLIPQSLAYAEIAGMPPVSGLYASTIPLLIAAPLVSSPYLQTGPVAVTSLLTLGALSSLAPVGSDEYLQLGLLLALVVGVVRTAIGLSRAGGIAYLMSRPMLSGFIPAAALLILSSQVPNALGTEREGEGVVQDAFTAVVDPAAWKVAALLMAAGAILLVFGGRRIHPVFPGVLLAVAVATALSALIGYSGPTVGEIPSGLPPVSLDLPWAELPTLAVSGVVIGLVGFAEPASIARSFAAQERRPWDADREFISQGAANVAAAFTGGFPVGGSFSRSSLNRMAGARTRLSGAVTGFTVLAFLPLTFLLVELPKAILGAIVIAAVLPLLRFRPLIGLWSVSRPQFAVAGGTFVATLVLAPHVEQAVLIGIGLSLVVHLVRELRVDARVWVSDRDLHVRPAGVLWFASAQGLEDDILREIARVEEVDGVVVHLDGIGRLDVTGALALRSLMFEARSSALEVTVTDVHPRDRRLVDGVVLSDDDRLGDG